MAILNLIIQRFLNNQSILAHYNISKQDVLESIEMQEEIFYQIFPRKIDVGKNPDTLDWIIGRTKDANDVCAPRDIINLINAAISNQIHTIELGQQPPPDNNLFTRSAIKEAQSMASNEKVEKHLFAEYPSYRTWIECLREGKSRYSLSKLCEIWKKQSDEALLRINALADIGFWRKEMSGDEVEVWIPFIYRDGLDITQGKSE